MERESVVVEVEVICGVVDHVPCEDADSSSSGEGLVMRYLYHLSLFGFQTNLIPQSN